MVIALVQGKLSDGSTVLTFSTSAPTVVHAFQRAVHPQPLSYGTSYTMSDTLTLIHGVNPTQPVGGPKGNRTPIGRSCLPLSYYSIRVEVAS